MEKKCYKTNKDNHYFPFIKKLESFKQFFIAKMSKKKKLETNSIIIKLYQVFRNLIYTFCY